MRARVRARDWPGPRWDCSRAEWSRRPGGAAGGAGPEAGEHLRH
jgi:hypothetical protein